MQTIYNHLDNVVRSGNESGLGVVRRHCRNGNKLTVIFQGKAEDGTDIVTLNFADGCYCILPESMAVWQVLLTIKAAVGCPVVAGLIQTWSLTQAWIDYAANFVVGVSVPPLVQVPAGDCPGCCENMLSDADRASYLGVCSRCADEYHNDTTTDEAEFDLYAGVVADDYGMHD